MIAVHADVTDGNGGVSLHGLLIDHISRYSMIRLASVILVALVLWAPRAHSQTHVALIPTPAGGSPVLDTLVHPMSTMPQFVRPEMGATLIPLGEIGRLPQQFVEGRSVILFSEAVAAPTSIWSLMLASAPVNVNGEDEMLPVERQPEMDLERFKAMINYPPEAKAQGISGKVIVSARIGPSGQTEAVQIASSDNPMLNAAAAMAVLMTPFTPALVDGQPTPTWVRVPVQFKLD